MIDLKAIRDVASVTSDSERMQFKPSTVIAMLDRLEAAEKDAERLDWLLAYLVSDDTSKDDEIVAASEVGVDMIKTAIDTAMKEQK